MIAAIIVALIVGAVNGYALCWWHMWRAYKDLVRVLQDLVPRVQAAERASEQAAHLMTEAARRFHEYTERPL